MDNLENPLVIGKFYSINPQMTVQYTGIDDDGKNYLFEWTNPLNQKKVIKRTQLWLRQFPPILLTYNDEIYEDKSDDEFLDDPFIKNNGGRNRNRNIIKYVKKSKVTKKYRKTKINKKYRKTKINKKYRKTKFTS